MKKQLALHNLFVLPPKDGGISGELAGDGAGYFWVVDQAEKGR